MLKWIWCRWVLTAFVRSTRAPTNFERSEWAPCLLVFSFECPPDKTVAFVEAEMLGYMASREVSKFRDLRDKFPTAGWQHSACVI